MVWKTSWTNKQNNEVNPVCCLWAIRLSCLAMGRLNSKYAYSRHNYAFIVVHLSANYAFGPPVWQLVQSHSLLHVKMSSGRLSPGKAVLICLTEEACLCQASRGRLHGHPVDQTGFSRSHEERGISAGKFPSQLREAAGWWPEPGEASMGRSHSWSFLWISTKDSTYCEWRAQLLLLRGTDNLQKAKADKTVCILFWA